MESGRSGYCWATAGTAQASARTTVSAMRIMATPSWLTCRCQSLWCRSTLMLPLLFQLCSRRLHRFRPFHRLGAHEVRELPEREVPRLGALLRDPRRGLRRAQRLRELVVEAAHDVARRRGRRKWPVPVRHVVALQAGF